VAVPRLAISEVRDPSIPPLAHQGKLPVLRFLHQQVMSVFHSSSGSRLSSCFISASLEKLPWASLAPANESSGSCCSRPDPPGCTIFLFNELPTQSHSVPWSFLPLSIGPASLSRRFLRHSQAGEGDPAKLTISITATVSSLIVVKYGCLDFGEGRR
jgi:hypothetical protein